MQKLSESDRLIKKCACVVTSLVDTLPLLLSRIEPEEAAQIIAGLAKSIVTATSLKIVPQQMTPAEALAELVKQIKENCDQEKESDNLAPPNSPLAKGVRGIDSLPEV